MVARTPKIWEGKKRAQFGAISDNVRFGQGQDVGKQKMAL